MVNCFDIEDQPHLLKCIPLLNKLDKKHDLKKISYDNIFSKIKKQKKVTEVFAALLDIQSSLLLEQED